LRLLFWRQSGFPYIAEGTSIQKLAQINAIPYLRHCYEQLGSSENTFFVYGHSASINDSHIFDALFTSSISHLYFCVHRPTANVPEIDAELARHQKRLESTIKYTLVDAESANSVPITAFSTGSSASLPLIRSAARRPKAPKTPAAEARNRLRSSIAVCNGRIRLMAQTCRS
jgi:hypothetical protein